LLPGVTAEEKSRLLPILEKAGMKITMHRFYFIRNDNAPGFYEITGNADNYGKENQNLYPITSLTDFEELIFKALWGHIQGNQELRVQEAEEKDEIAQELDFHYRYIDSRTYNFCGRQELLADIGSAVQNALAGNLSVFYTNSTEKAPTQTVMVVSVGYDNALRVWDIDTGSCLKILTGHGDTIYSVVLHPDGKRAISGSIDYTARIWDLDTGNCLTTLKGHTGYLFSQNAVALTADGQRVVTASHDKTVRVWNLNTGECLHILEHTHYVDEVALCPNAPRVITGSRDSVLRLWDMDTGGCLKTQEHAHYTDILAYHTDGQRVVSAGDKNMRLWDMEKGASIGSWLGDFPLGGMSLATVLFSRARPYHRRLL
jgi:WD40 repeat protein